MKSNARQSVYFSAYPLKALEKEIARNPNGQSPYLKAILSGKTRTMSRVRVMPMPNPYLKTPAKFTPKAGQLPKDIELTEKDWFNNYE
jgi:hypothetical protein